MCSVADQMAFNKSAHPLCISVDSNRRATAARREGPYSWAIKRNGSEPSMSSSACKGSQNPPAGADQGFNVICTTYRLTEHYHYWTKNNPMNVQLVPEPFVEVPAELADRMGIRGGERVKVTSARSHYIAKAMVTRRIRPMKIDGKEMFQIGLPIHWGFRGIAEDEGKTAKTLANQLTPTVIDPNAFTPEFKGFLVKIEKA
jgi:anaerobic selenocysteine-containing dehydrogenase